jgi:hypothetical protein
MSVTYNATLTMREETVCYLSRLLHHERVRRGTRTGSRALGCFTQAVLVIRWFLDGTQVTQLADDHAIGRSTCYDYLHEGIDVLASQAPELNHALQAAKTAGHEHVAIDGTLIYTDRCRTPGPTPGVDLWWSGKHIKSHSATSRYAERLTEPRGSYDQVAVVSFSLSPSLDTCFHSCPCSAGMRGSARLASVEQRARPARRPWWRRLPVDDVSTQGPPEELRGHDSRTSMCQVRRVAHERSREYCLPGQR